MSPVPLADPTPITFEDKEQGFTFEYPGHWYAYKNNMSWKISPPLHAYDFPYMKAAISFSYITPGSYGNSFEDINWPPILETIAGLPVLQVDSSTIGDAQALILHSEQEITEYSITLEKTKILIDAGGGGFYLFAYESEKGNPAYEPFLEEVEKIIQTFR